MTQKATAVAAGDWQFHSNTPTCASCLMQSFLAKHQTQVTQPLYSRDLSPSKFWLFPKLRSSLKGKRFQTMKFRKIWWGSWWQLGELCGSRGAYFEGDWGVIVLCTMFLVPGIFFNKCLYFSYYMVGYLLDIPCMLLSHTESNITFKAPKKLLKCLLGG